MNEKVRRIYAGKDAEMLLALDVIIDAAIENEAAIQATRPLWNEALYLQLKARIMDAAQNILGANNLQALKKATAGVNQLENIAREDLSFIKLQIEEDFRKEPARMEHILETLGYTALYPLRGKDQETLTTFLFRFTTGLTPAIEEELLAKGMSPLPVNRLKVAASPFMEANSGQEKAKSSRPQITAKAINTLNDLYQDVMGIGKIASRIFMKNKPLKARFSYARIIKTMNNL